MEKKPTIRRWVAEHRDNQIFGVDYDANLLQRRLVIFLHDFEFDTKTERDKAELVGEELRYIKGSPNVREEQHPELRKALYDARNVKSNEWTGVLLEYSEILCQAGKGLKPRLVNYRLNKKAHLITYIRLLEVAHHYGYEIDENE